LCEFESALQNEDFLSKKELTMGIWNNKRLAVLSAILLIGLSCSRAAAAPTNVTACGTFGAGSYIVENNISVGTVNCLTFNAGPATLDLNGFTVSGSGVSTNGVLAINVPNLTVRNGTIKGFSRSIYATGTGVVVDGVRALSGNLNAITVGSSSTIENCLVSGHSGGGVQAGSSATVVNNTLTGNTGDTIVVGDASLVKGNRTSLNTGGSTAAIRIQTARSWITLFQAIPSE